MLCVSVLSFAGLSRVLGQPGSVPSLYLDADNVCSCPASIYRQTNYNTSLELNSSPVAVNVGTLRTGGAATVMTVYETSKNDTLGVWELGSGDNRALWLNSLQASYDDFVVDYHNYTDTGVIVHTMYCVYPPSACSYSGSDTLFLGREGVHGGRQRFCSLLYFDSLLNRRQQRVWESALAVRYGALLQSVYVDRLDSILWDPLKRDAAYSKGVCGIGRDDDLGLCQSQSVCRGDVSTLLEQECLDNLDYVMMGHNGRSATDGQWFLREADSVLYWASSRVWKLRAHVGADSTSVSLFFAVPLADDVEAGVLLSGGGREVLLPAVPNEDGFVIEGFWLQNGVDYYLKFLKWPVAGVGGTPGAKVSSGRPELADGGSPAGPEADRLRLTVSPNPTSRYYRARVELEEPGGAVLEVADGSGRLVERAIVPGPVSEYTHEGGLPAAGVYYVSVSSNGRRQTVKLIVAN